MYYISIDPQEFHRIPHGLSMDSPLKVSHLPETFH